MSAKSRTLMAKKLVEFIRQHPEGVTSDDISKAGLPLWPVERLITLKLVKGEQVKEPERGPRCYHWLFKPSGGNTELVVEGEHNGRVIGHYEARRP